jgi:CRISPR-associated protein Csx10
MSSSYTLQLKLLSSTLVGSGLGFGANVDSDVVFDDTGIPYIPAKRIKGCLKDAATEVHEMFSLAKIDQVKIKSLFGEIKSVFGEPGSKTSAPVYFSNLYIKDYELNKNWLNYFLKSGAYSQFITQELILKAFSESRQQTKINDDGTAFDHSLRTIRVLKKGLTFYGSVRIEANGEKLEQFLDTLLLACLNFRCFGTKRNRGFGEVDCCLLSNEEVIPIKEKLEHLCTL